MKVETHNHPTAISPFPGASTGAGGEIRDEGATGRGAKPKAGLTGFTVSNLMLPGAERPWENAASVTAPFAQRAEAGVLRQAGAHRLAAADHDRRPDRRRRVQQRIRPPGPGRLLPHLRAERRRRRRVRLPQADHDRGRHRQHLRPAHPQERHPGRQPADPAGRPGHAHRHGRQRRVVDGDRHQHRRPGLRLGPARQSGDGTPRAGSDQRAAGRWARTIRSSRSTTSARAACRTPSRKSPTTPGRGAIFDLRKVPLEESGMAPKEIWSNESQERYVLAIAPDNLPLFAAHVRARALPVCRSRRRHRRTPAAR